MNNRYLTILFLTIGLMVAATVLVTTRVDPFGIYGNDSEASLSRIDQFYHMRSTKPLTVQNKKASRVIVGSSRAARLSPSSLHLDDFYNAAIPGATPTEIRQLLKYVNYIQPLETAVIGWDFEGFLSLTPEVRSGFNTDLLDSSNPVSHALYSFIAHKRTAFSFVALMESHRAHYAIDKPGKPSYLSDGSWHRNQPKYIGPFVFSMISREKLDTFEREKPLAMDTTEIARTLNFCHDNNIQCKIFPTPVHLFHFEIFRQTGVMGLWKQWHRRLVAINQRVATEKGREPFTVWGFNAFAPAVNEPIKVARELETPWFTDNLHFRPRFADVMLADMMGDGSTDVQGQLLTPENIEAYIEMVLALQREYVKADRRAVNSLKKNLKF